MEILITTEILSVKLTKNDNESRWHGQITSMDESLRRTNILKDHGIFQGVKFVSWSSPEFYIDTFYLRGIVRNRDNHVFYVEDEQQFIRAVIDFGANYKFFQRQKILNEINTFLANKSYRYQILDTNSLIPLKSE